MARKMATAGVNGLKPPTKNKRAENDTKGNGYLDANGRFNGKPGPGRRPGRPNKTTGILKEAILLAAANVGDILATERIDKAIKDEAKPSRRMAGWLATSSTLLGCTLRASCRF